MAMVRNHGHKVFFIDNYLSPQSFIEEDFLQSNNIEAIGIYSNTICYQDTLRMVTAIENLRKSGLWTGKIIVGGPHTSVGADNMPEFIDHIVLGEGEQSVLDIINGDIHDRIIVGKKISDLDSLPMPAWENFIHLPYQWNHSWIDSYPVYTLNTSRGCPFQCAFCSVKSIWGRTFRYMSAARIVNDIEYMQKHYGARCIYFREDHFTLNKKRIIEFCELLLKKNIEIDWMCETRADQLGDPDYQALMARAGCKVFYIGVESGSPRMLEFFKKGETVEQFIQAFDIAHKVGIKTYGSFIVGAPTETADDLSNTHKLIDRIKPDHVGLNVYIGLPGSELYEYTRKNGLYEYEDENKVLYLNGHNKRVDTYYDGNSKLKIPGTEKTISLALKKVRNKLSAIIKEG